MRALVARLHYPPHPAHPPPLRLVACARVGGMEDADLRSGAPPADGHRHVLPHPLYIFSEKLRSPYA